MDLPGELTAAGNWWLIAAMAPLLFNTIYYGTLFLLGFWSHNDDISRNRRHAIGHRTVARPGVTMVIPARNEAPVIVTAVANALGQNYPEFEIIVIDDNSDDETVSHLIEAFDLRPARVEPRHELRVADVAEAWESPELPLRLVHVRGAGSKSAAVNLGIELAGHPFIAIRDADSLMEPDVLDRCMSEVIHSSETVIAVGCTLLPANDCEVADAQVARRRPARRGLVAAQTIEYLSSFFLARPGMASQGMLPFVSGGFGLFSREALFAVGGLQPGHLGEDLDLCLRLHRHYGQRPGEYTMANVPEAVVWTEVPTTFADLRRQRRRWQWGFQRSMNENRDLQRLESGSARRGFLYLYVFEWWGLFLEAASWALAIAVVLLGLVSVQVTVLTAVLGQLVALAVLAIAVQLGVRRTSWLAGGFDLLSLAGATLLFTFGYRQLTTIWRIEALFATNRPWGDLHRRGFVTRELELT